MLANMTEEYQRKEVYGTRTPLCKQDSIRGIEKKIIQRWR